MVWLFYLRSYNFIGQCRVCSLYKHKSFKQNCIQGDYNPVLYLIFFSFVLVCVEQPGTTWCVTPCVQMQDVGVLAQTSVSPADTSAVDEPVWISATSMKGEQIMHLHVHLRSDN